MKNASYFVWNTWQNIFAGSDKKQNLPFCQSTTCIVLLYPFKHLEFTSCLGASRFSGEKITNPQGRQLWSEVLGGEFVRLQGCQVDSLDHLGNIRDGGGEWETLSSLEQLLLRCPSVGQWASKWSCGNSLGTLGSSHKKGLPLCVGMPS